MRVSTSAQGRGSSCCCRWALWGPRARTAIRTAAATLLATLSLGALATEAGTTPVLRVEAYRIDGPNPLPADLTERILAPHLGPKTQLAELIAAVDTLQLAIRERGFVFHRVVLPPQTIEAGVVVLAISRLELGEVTVVNNVHFDADNVLHTLPTVRTGATPDIKRLTRNLALANQHPARRIRLNLAESKRPDVVDAVLEVQDRRPYGAFLNVANTGTDRTGRTRTSLGLHHDNLLGVDDRFTAVYTTYPDDPGSVRQIGIDYLIPSYVLGGTFGFHYATSDVDTGIVEDVFDVSGAGDFLSLSYVQYLAPHGAYRHQAGIALDDRRYDSDIAFLGTPIGSRVRSRPVTLHYEGSYRGTRHTLNFRLAYAHNINTGARNGRVSYEAARAGADTRWQTLSVSASASWTPAPGWKLRAELDAQKSPDALISGEEFGAGGIGSVRGFEQRALSGDSGLRLGLEVAPPTPLAQLSWLVFAERAWTDRNRVQPGERDHDAIASAGVGLRWRWREHVVARADYGWALDDARNPEVDGDRFHFSVFVRL